MQFKNISAIDFLTQIAIPGVKSNLKFNLELKTKKANNLLLNDLFPIFANMRSEPESGPFNKYPCFVIESACERVISSSIRS